MNLLKFGLIAVAGLSFGISCTQTPPSQTAANTVPGANRSPATVPASNAAPSNELAAAKEIYAMNCMICHKDSGKGGKITIGGKPIDPEDLTSDKIKAMTDEKLIGYVTNGVEDEGMPAFKDKLTPEQIRSVIKHVRTMQN